MLKKIDFTSYKTILFVALIFRLIAAIFSEGYGMHDDHFLIVEAASSWSDGFDYNHWLPWSTGNSGVPEGHSFTYVGLNYIFFVIFKFFGITDPKTLMIFNRLIHGLVSLLVVHFGMKITEKISNRKNAVTVGWILAILWVLPFLSVRNLVEMASIPFLIWGVWLTIKDNQKWDLLFAGLLIGLAVSFRFQVGIFAIGIAAFYFFKWQWKKFFLFSLGVVLTFCITQGAVDFFIWGYPFAELAGYIVYNMHEGTEYMANTNYFMYFYVLFGVLLVPLGILIAIGFFRSPKQQWLVIAPSAVMLLLHIFLPSMQIWWILIVFLALITASFLGKFKKIQPIWIIYLPTIFFILFHTFYPNRQERFVLTVLPLVIILGVIGFDSLRKSEFWNKTWRISWTAFWILNIPLLLFFTVASSKKSRIDAMYSMRNEHLDHKNILLEASGKSSTSLMPKFYAKSWYCDFAQREEPTEPLLVRENTQFDYILFFGEDDLNKRIGNYRQIYPKMFKFSQCDPSLIDKILFTLNPKNTNQYIEVWKTNNR
jgi:hypothetical protein